MKRQRLSDDDSDQSDVPGDLSDGSEASSSDHIGDLKPQKSHQTKKRKIRATGATAFGETLQSLLSTDAPSGLPLSLKPSVGRKRNDEKLELRAKKVLQGERKDKEDKGRIKDVIGGWGGESERALRKVAQRGVVKLFNVIQQSQASAAAVVQENKAARGSGKATLPAPVEKPVNKSEFLDFIRAGAVVSKR
ncbi:Rrp15p-domain-containing protein [Mycena amicta]|nr:Rrp15p-domain-containing protein [Mycena amicta]